MYRFVPFALAAATLVACDSEFLAPDADVPYELQTVFDGEPLPYTYPIGSGCVGPDGGIYDDGLKTTVLENGEFVFNASSDSYTLVMDGRTRCQTSAGITDWEPYQHITEGGYEEDRELDRFLLWPVSDPSPDTPNNYVAEVRADTLYLREPLYLNLRATFTR